MFIETIYCYFAATKNDNRYKCSTGNNHYKLYEQLLYLMANNIYVCSKYLSR